jgi:hypothetical protein
VKKSVAKVREYGIIYLTKAIQNGLCYGNFGEHGGLRDFGYGFGGILSPGRYHKEGQL